MGKGGRGLSKRKPEAGPRILNQQDIAKPRAHSSVFATWRSVACVPVGQAEHQDADLTRQAG